MGRMLTHYADGRMKSAEELLEAYFSQASDNGRAQLASAITVVTAAQIAAAAHELREAVEHASGDISAAAGEVRRSIDRASAASSRHERLLVIATVVLAAATAVLAFATIVLALRAH